MAPSTVAPFPSFAGFSKDGKTFAWVTPSTSAVKWRKSIGVGEKDPQRRALAGTLDEGAADLKKEGYSSERRPPPADLTFEAHLTARPPKLVLERAGKTVDVPIGNLPYTDKDVAELWGMSPDGTLVAIHIAGNDIHYAFVARAP